MIRSEAPPMPVTSSTPLSRLFFHFGNGDAEGDGTLREVLGGKGAGLAEMTNAGVPVPPGFTITTEVCRYFASHGRELPPGFEDAAEGRRSRGSRATMGKRLGDPADPLLVSRALGRQVLHARHDGHHPQPRPERPRRCRACRRAPATRASPGTATAASSRCSATSCWASRRTTFEEHARRPQEERRRARPDTDLTAEDLRGAGRRSFKAVVRKQTGPATFPQDPLEQLAHGPRRRVPLLEQRPRHLLPPAEPASPTTSAPRSTCRPWCSATWATTSATGVGFTRNPATGENEFYGEYLINAQGEDVVAGIRTPHADRTSSRQRRCRAGSTAQLREITAAAREALPRRAGLRVHHPGGHALHAADAHRQAHRRRPRCGSRSRWWTRG